MAAVPAALPDFVEGYPVSAIYNGTFYGGWYPNSGDKFIGAGQYFSQNVEQTLQIRITYITSNGQYFYVENAGTTPGKTIVVGAYQLSSTFYIPAGERWLFKRTGVMYGYPIFNVTKY